jgi:thiamine pyrophosphate-dependent acetolactate synthase large subunit-like protein
MKIQVSTLIVRLLQQLGVDTLFGMPGAPYPAGLR